MFEIFKKKEIKENLKRKKKITIDGIERSLWDIKEVYDLPTEEVEKKSWKQTKSKMTYRYQVDDILYYEPFKNDENIISELLKNISEKCVILNVNHDSNKFYDYEICILSSGEFKKVKEQTLTSKEQH